jgi:predicted MPP superfamily phosphohydrolase
VDPYEPNRIQSLKSWQLAAASATAVGAGMLLYGAAVEAGRLTVERSTLPVPFWPERLNGFKIALLADFHLRGRTSLKLCKQAVAAALEASPDMVAIVGDVVSYWSPEFPAMVGEMLEPLLLMNGAAVAVYGNHDYDLGPPENLGLIYNELNIKLLRNDSWHHAGITWVGVDSASKGLDNPNRAMAGVEGPAICLWHEPDVVDLLPKGCSLMLSGHSHGGQFSFPGGFTPMHTDLGRIYPRGFYPDAPTPLYVSRGIGTTGPPSRFLCSPEVSILTLVRDERYPFVPSDKSPE